MTPYFIWGSAALFYLYEFFVRVAPSVMEPQLQANFRLTAGALGGLMGIYFYIYAPMQLIAGICFDRVGARYILFPAALLCSFGCFLEVAGCSPWILGLARFLQGLGSAFAFIGTMYLATRWFPPHRLAFLSGLTTALGVLGAIFANIGIAKVVEKWGWQITLWNAGFVGLGIALLTFLFIPVTSPGASHLEAKTKESDQAFSIFKALRTVLSNPQSWLIGLISTALYMPLSVLGTLWGVQYITTVFGENSVMASGAISMLYGGWLVVGPLSGWISDRLGHRKPLLIGSSILTALFTTCLFFLSHLPTFLVYGLMLLIGIASSVQVLTFATAVEHNPKRLSGTAIAFTNMLVMLLGGAMQPLIGIILDKVSGPMAQTSGAYAVKAYQWAMMVIPVSCIISIIAALFLRESYKKQ